MQISTRSSIIVLLSLSGIICFGQKITRVGKSPIVCYASTENVPTKIGPPQSQNAPGARTKSANIEVVYNGFSQEAQNAFQFAVDIWEGLLTSPVTIRVSANWTVLGNGVLGSAGPTFYASDFEGAPNINVSYPGSLAEKLAGKELNDPAEFDISANFNSDFNWYYSSTGTPAQDQYDLISVVLHELGHGLGFVDTYNFASGVGEYGSFTDGVPFAFDLTIETIGATNLYQNFTSPSSQLGTQLVSNNLFYNSSLAISNNGGLKPKVYAPTTWNGGSSIAHLDETTYPSGNINSLMSPQFAAREVIHDPGPITVNLFKDLGWSTIYINHAPIPSTENTSSPSFDVMAIITPDNTPNYDLVTSDIFLKYYTSADATVISLPMTATGSLNEYSATLPAPGGSVLDYFYYIGAGDNLTRTITNPGKVNTPLEAPAQGYFKFHVGPDTDAPVITHTPLEYISFQESEITIEAEIVERADLSSVELDYLVASVQQPNAPMTLVDTKLDPLTGLTTYSYELTIPVPSLTDGDEFAYKIVAEDNSLSVNVGATPASDFYRLTYKGLKPLQNDYNNDFNLASDDFIGKAADFNIIQPAGFNDPAIHSVHPYIEASSIGLDSINYIYTLRVPILVRGIEATIKFDEIALVEPGEPGSVFPNQDFYDYVVVEASKDAGMTWTAVADGYDSRDYAPWLTKYNSSTSGGNSTAIGDPSLFRTRKLNLLNKFNEGDEIVVRFRLYSDPGAAGWGWAVDNLKVQIDDESPTLLHQHIDFVKAGTTSLDLNSAIRDNILIDKVMIEFGINDQPVETREEIISANSVQAGFSLDITSLSADDKIIYKLSAIDTSGNLYTVPSTGYFEVPIVDFEPPVNQYSNNFNSASDDFVGNFFSVEQPTNFIDGAIHSSHNYLAGFGADSISDFAYTLKKPITISQENTYMRFDEIALVEGQAGGVVFGTPAFNDYVIVEGSKDEGETWSTFLDGYDAVSQSAWLSTFNSLGNGTPSLFRTRTFDMTENGNFVANDEVIIRFRLFSNETINGWGWAIDNLYIQDIITSTEKELETAVTVYPNPAKENIVIEADGLSSPYFKINLINMQGQKLYEANVEAVNGKISHTILATAISSGLYFVKVSNEGKTVIRKVFKTN